MDPVEFARDAAFRSARTYNDWTSEAVSDGELEALYDLMKWGPTSGNACPARIVFVRSEDGKKRLAGHAFERNAAKILVAPVTAVVGYDTRFFEHLPVLFPHNPAMAGMFEANPALAEQTAFRNGSLQGAYLIVAARLLGLDAGPMSGFDNAGVDADFFPDGRFKSNFLCSLGHGDAANQWPRLPRPAFAEACALA